MTGKTSPFVNVASSSDLQDKATDLQEQLEHIMEEEFPDIFRRTIKSQPSQPSCQGATATAETVDAKSNHSQYSGRSRNCSNARKQWVQWEVLWL